MRLAVFTNQFPGRVSTFFARDMCALLEAGIDIDIFPIYPLDSDLWRYVPTTLHDTLRAKSQLHHMSLRHSLRAGLVNRRAIGAIGDTLSIAVSAARFGFQPLLKSLYVLPKALAWARCAGSSYDHILAYWGNYAATCAYLFHRLIRRSVPFSMFLHAGTDLYRDQVFLRHKLSYADSIVTVCEYNRQFIRQLYPDLFGSIAHKIHIHHLGLDFAEFPYSPQVRIPGLCLAVGYFGKVKGFDYLIRALADLRRRGVDAQVELIGDGDMAPALQALVAQLGLTEHVRFRGWLPFAEVQSAMRRAAVLVHPSIGLGDAVPTVIKEAMAVGTPVVASRVAGIPELLDDGEAGVLVPPKDALALADQLEVLLADAELRRSYAVAGRVYAEKMFDLGRNGQRLAAHLLSTKRLAAG